MSRKRKLFISLAMLMCVAGGFVSCQDDIAESDHYKSPEWLKGNAYEVLQQEGKYKSFLKAVDYSDYRQVVAGKTIVTVMAPDDDAFASFLAKKGYSSVDDLYNKDPKYLNQLVGYHLMYYAYNWDKMVNFRPDAGDAATEEQKQKWAG